MRLSAKVEALIRNLNVEQTLTQHEDKALPVKRYIYITDMVDVSRPEI
jgi:hypothetical protein